MSLPPETIQVKRKIDSEHGPVNYLRVDESKRRRSTWLYQRKQPGPDGLGDVGSQAQANVRPRINLSPHGGPKHKSSSSTIVATSAQLPPTNNTRPTATGPSPAPSTPPPTCRDTEPRRFHLTRLQPVTPSAGVLSSGVSKNSRYSSALFVERSAKRKRADAAAAGKLDVDDSVSRPPQHIPSAAAIPGSRPEKPVQDASPQRFKRPGQAGRTQKKEDNPLGGTRRPTPKPELPPSLANRQIDVDMEQLSRDMDTYALEQIGLNLSRIDEIDQENKKATPATPKKYHPKAPAKRYAERHPEAATPGQAPGGVEVGESDSEDGDYVIETYFRVSADTITSIPFEQVGLLVFDNEPDVEFFYGAESDSDDEQLEDDEDSNAEDYYRADYPDDEVESDDEYNRDPYLYRTGNASDLEEFDEDEAANSDEESSSNAGGLASLRARVFGTEQSRP